MKNRNSLILKFSNNRDLSSPYERILPGLYSYFWILAIFGRSRNWNVALHNESISVKMSPHFSQLIIFIGLIFRVSKMFTIPCMLSWSSMQWRSRPLLNVLDENARLLYLGKRCVNFPERTGLCELIYIEFCPVLDFCVCLLIRIVKC